MPLFREYFLYHFLHFQSCQKLSSSLVFWPALTSTVYSETQGKKALKGSFLIEPFWETLTEKMALVFIVIPTSKQLQTNPVKSPWDKFLTGPMGSRKAVGAQQTPQPGGQQLLVVGTELGSTPLWSHIQGPLLTAPIVTFIAASSLLDPEPDISRPRSAIHLLALPYEPIQDFIYDNQDIETVASRFTLLFLTLPPAFAGHRTPFHHS